MSRLASFKGPSTPTSSPVQARQPVTPISPSRLSESTYHRKLRSLLQELRAVTETWDDIVLVDGLKAAKTLVDARTELDNDLAVLPAGTRPAYRIVQPKLELMEGRIADLDAVIVKLKKQFAKMNNLVDSIEAILFEAHKVKGWEWVQDPLWVTWSLEKFVSSVPEILIPYHRSLEMHIELVDTLRSHDVTFEASRYAIAQWVVQPHLEEGSWDAQWEDLCAAEIDRWNSR
ncbi:hypothetical protein SCP_0407520 [Sparassis crispa]|uniref:Uncharacterized protein n=1 Tax=Sparassis crispa TaxID=139825 RepID=A0A401GJM3_9APHY|nr:hypothetical protein SCP_0407520 [Sparassis crispa]GBE82368.1 hypothetical protein SCP_0407520 [Sparassis crispa]